MKRDLKQNGAGPIWSLPELQMNVKDIYHRKHRFKIQEELLYNF